MSTILQYLLHLREDADLLVLDTNNIIILYPQATVDYTLHQIWNGSITDNRVGCFDWIGWSGENADQKGGPQLEAIVNMVRRIMGISTDSVAQSRSVKKSGSNEQKEELRLKS